MVISVHFKSCKHYKSKLTGFNGKTKPSSANRASYVCRLYGYVVMDTFFFHHCSTHRIHDTKHRWPPMKVFIRLEFVNAENFGYITFFGWKLYQVIFSYYNFGFESKEKMIDIKFSIDSKNRKCSTLPMLSIHEIFIRQLFDCSA